MVNYFFVIIKVTGSFERELKCQNVKIAEKQQLLEITAAFQCAQPTGNLNRTFKRYQFMKMAEWSRKPCARNALRALPKKDNIRK